MVTITQISSAEIESKQIFSWPIWTCEVSEFNWEYAEEESCYIVEGTIEVYVDNKVFHISDGDFVVFEKGLQCRWKVLKPVKKHYTFNQ